MRLKQSSLYTTKGGGGDIYVYSPLKKSTKTPETSDVLELCFDFTQNMQLPKLTVQDPFYLWQLAVNDICV
jgi:hypothetical protein